MDNPTLVRDWRGRAYAVGDTPRDRPRTLLLAWAAMIAIAPLQYGYAAAVPALVERGLTPATALLPLAVWIVCQAGVAIPALRLVRRGRLGLRTALGVCGLLTVLALISVAAAHASLGGVGASVVMLVGYGVLGGLGGGLVYAMCAEAVARWFPERPSGRVGLITGAFAYGATPAAVAIVLDARALPAVFLLWAVVAAAAIAPAACLLRLPCPNWWPAETDPRAHALDEARLRRTPPALRQFSLRQALRTPTMAALVLILVCAGAGSIYNAVTLAALGSWLALALFLVLNGAGRAAAMFVSGLLGRRLVLGAVLALFATGQLLLVAGSSPPGPMGDGSAGVVILGAVLAGLGGGAFYPLLASLVREYFGEERISEIHGVVYGAKALAGVVGVGLVVLAGFEAFGVTAALAAVATVAALRLRRPGFLATRAV